MEDRAAPVEPHDALDNPFVPKGAATLITDDTALGEMIAHLRDAGTFAYDSEFIGELTYFPKLCLIQVASKERVGLIDPLFPAGDWHWLFHASFIIVVWPSLMWSLHALAGRHFTM